MDKIKVNVLNPCIEYLVKQFYPYIITTCIIFILTFVLAIVILYILVTNKTNKSSTYSKIQNI